MKFAYTRGYAEAMYPPPHRRATTTAGRLIQPVVLGVLGVTAVVVLVAWLGKKDETLRMSNCDFSLIDPIGYHRRTAPDNWTHQDLLAHLLGHGVEYRMFPIESKSTAASAALFVVPTSKFAENREEAESGFFVHGDPDVVLVELLRPGEAKPVRAWRASERECRVGPFTLTGSQSQLLRILYTLPEQRPLAATP